MMDFIEELNKLLSAEPEAVDMHESEFSAILDSGQQLLASLNKTHADISLQVEEIYDIVKESDEFKKELKAEKAHLGELVGALIRLADIIEDFTVFTRNDKELTEGARMMWDNATAVLNTCAFTQFGMEGQQFDPAIHNVHSVATSAYPRGYIAQLLRSGYAYRGAILRKAIVVVSDGGGEEDSINE